MLAQWQSHQETEAQVQLDQVLSGGDQPGEDQGEVEGVSLNFNKGLLLDMKDKTLSDSRQKVELTNFSKGEIII